MGYSYAAIINKNNRANKSGKHTIFIRVTVDRHSKYFSIDERVEEKFWLGKENRWIRESHPFSFEINSIIKKKMEILHKYEYRQKLFGNGISIEGITEHFQKKADPNVFNEFVDEFMKTVRGKSDNTLKKYRTFVGYLNQFNPAINFSQLNENLFQSFASWLEKKGMIGVTVHKYFDPFKVMVKQAVKDGYLEKDPFLYVDIGIKATKGKRVYLEIEEITQLKKAKIPSDRPDLEVTRKHWLFCFYASFYYSDLRNLKWTDVKSTEYGYCLVAERFKNENTFIAPIHKFPFAIEILEGQKGMHPDLVFPNAITEQKYNFKLKELAELAGIKKKLMNKTARHSSIQFWEAQGLETQHTAKIAGHSKESTTKEYFELTARDISSRVAKFDFSELNL